VTIKLCPAVWGKHSFAGLVKIAQKYLRERWLSNDGPRSGSWKESFFFFFRPRTAEFHASRDRRMPVGPAWSPPRSVPDWSYEICAHPNGAKVENIPSGSASVTACGPRARLERVHEYHYLPHRDTPTNSSLKTAVAKWSQRCLTIWPRGCGPRGAERLDRGPIRTTSFRGKRR